MANKSQENTDTGIEIKGSSAKQLPGTNVQLFGHVTFVEGYDLPQFQGCHGLVALRDTPGKTVAVITSAHNLQTLLETALTTGNLISFSGIKATSPPTPLGGTWIVDVYLIDVINLYGFK
jgi:hypothetical protein